MSQSPCKGDKFKAVLIGISQFDDESYGSLPAVEIDVDKLTKCLITNLGFSEDAIIQYTSKDTKLEKDVILHDIISLSNIGVTDFLLLYFATHGDLDIDKNNAYIVTQDTRIKNKRSHEQCLKKSTAISSSELMNCISKLRADKVLVVLDICHTGGFEILISGRRRISIDDLKNFTSSTDMAIIASCLRDESFAENRMECLFTNSFIESLEELTNEDRGFLFGLVENLQRRMETSRQTPIFKCENITNSNELVMTKRSSKKRSRSKSLERSAYKRKKVRLEQEEIAKEEKISLMDVNEGQNLDTPQTQKVEKIEEYPENPKRFKVFKFSSYRESRYGGNDIHRRLW